jgi:NADH-quinone oxidoreductase subunit G
MADLVKLTIDGKEVQARPGTLVIDAAKTVGIEIPAFCYYAGLSLQAACRMCLVEVEKMPKLMTSCTLPVAEGMVVRTNTPQVTAARKYMLEFLLTNHPLDCPVCDKGGECELQDMVFRYGAGESRHVDEKVHTPEKQFSPVVFYDAPRCILCYRCVRICNEGMGVNALAVINRGVVSEIGPNAGDHLECDECGSCIDICPVGALTSGIYRYQTRPWEMTHVGTICTHCADGCKTTLGTRNNQVIRGNNRDRSGLNGEFLCIKGRYAFDFLDHAGRLRAPLVRVDGELKEASWSEALAAVAKRFGEIRAAGGSFGVIGSSHTTNEENYYLQKFARQVLGTANLDHHRTGDVPALLAALNGSGNKLATVDDLYNRKAVLVLGADLARQHPLLSNQARAGFRHHQSRIYAVTPAPVREDQYAAVSVRASGAGATLAALESLREKLQAETELVVVFDDTFQGGDVAKLVAFCESLGSAVKYVTLTDYANSRGALDMGLAPDLLPGYRPAETTGLNLDAMLATGLAALWVVGANPLEGGAARKAGFLVVQDLFLTETALVADVVLPAASLYEKSGTVTNVTGEVQRCQRAIEAMGAKPDLEIMGFLAREMGVAAELGPWTNEAVLEEIRRTVPGYDLPPVLLAAGGAVQVPPPASAAASGAGVVRSDRNGLFASGTLGRYCDILHKVLESRSGY